MQLVILSDRHNLFVMKKSIKRVVVTVVGDTKKVQGVCELIKGQRNRDLLVSLTLFGGARLGP